MNKLKTVAALLLALVMACLTACGSTPAAASAPQEASSGGAAQSQAAAPSEEGKTISIGYAASDLSSTIGAEIGAGLEKVAKEQGIQMTIVDAQGNAATQISQIENFIENNVDGLLVTPVSSGDELSDVIHKAIEKDIKVLSHDTELEEASVNYLIDNYELGRVVGEQAAAWINENLDGKAEVGILGYPTVQTILDRAQGMVDAINELAPESEIVAEGLGAYTAESMEYTENFLQAHPDMKVICSIGDGGAIGANEAVVAAGKDAADFGIFSCDATQEALSIIKSDGMIRMSVSLGSGEEIAAQEIDLLVKLINGEDIDKEQFRSMVPVNKDNVDEFIQA